MQIAQDCRSKGRALRGVGSGPKLVEEDEGTLIHLRKEGNDIRHVGRKGTEALLNALFIPDVRIDLLEHGKFGTVKRRDVKPRLPHEGK